MFFWWFMFVCNMLYSIVMILGGWFMWKYCPKNMSALVGYRTRRSMLNQETWQFAHEHCGKLWWRIGWILLPLTALVQIPFYGNDEDTLGTLALVICIVGCAIILLSIIPTEKALKKHFTDDGQRI